MIEKHRVGGFKTGRSVDGFCDGGVAGSLLWWGCRAMATAATRTTITTTTTWAVIATTATTHYGYGDDHRCINYYDDYVHPAGLYHDDCYECGGDGDDYDYDHGGDY